jgi:hypothetical protein
MIGALVVFACLGLFGAMSRAQNRHQVRAAQTDDFTRAYRIIERSFQLLVMAETTQSSDPDGRRRIDRDLQRSDGLLLDDDPAEADEARFLLQADASAPGSLEYDGRTAPAQRLRLALRGPPVAGGFSAPAAIDAAMFSDSALDRQAREREKLSRKLERHRRAGPDGTLTSSTATNAAVAAAAGAHTGPASAGADENADDSNISAVAEPRAPGVRAEFLLLPDGVAPSSNYVSPTATGSSIALIGDDSDAPPALGWTLWYRELPPRNPADALSPEDRARARAGDASVLDFDIDQADLDAEPVDPASLRTIRLLSNLKTCRWRVYRAGRNDTRMLALSARELPAYAELDIETLNGRQEHWMFEVGWSIGSEPGQRLVLAPDALNSGAGGLIDTDGDGIPDTPANQSLDDPNTLANGPSTGPVNPGGDGVTPHLPPDRPNKYIRTKSGWRTRDPASVPLPDAPGDRVGSQNR